jgi:hypothetical protein
MISGPIYCFLAVLLVRITVITALKKGNYKPSLNDETERELYKYGNFIMKHDLFS